MDPNSVIAAFTVVIAVATITYVVLTALLWRETKKSADAAQKSADTAQKSIDLTIQQLAEQLGFGPRIVLEAIEETQMLILYWREKAAVIAPPPNANPDPSGLAAPSLLRAVDHARRISEQCAQLMVQANANLRNAKSELEIAYAATKKQTFTTRPTHATEYLQTATDLLAKARELVLEHMQQHGP